MVSEGTEVTEHPAAHTSLCESSVGHLRLLIVIKLPFNDAKTHVNVKVHTKDGPRWIWVVHTNVTLNKFNVDHSYDKIAEVRG